MRGNVSVAQRALLRHQAIKMGGEQRMKKKLNQEIESRWSKNENHTPALILSAFSMDVLSNMWPQGVTAGS